MISKLRMIRRKFEFPFPPLYRKRKCVFIHIPKVAGTSILLALGMSGRGREHLPWYVYYSADPTYYNSAFKFAFVRNPWERTLSAYRCLKFGGDCSPPTEVITMLKKYDSFDSFIINGLAKGVLRNHILFLPQSQFIANSYGDIAIDFVGRYETLHKDYHFVASRLGLKRKLPDENISKGRRQAYQKEYLSERAVNIVKDLYIQDIKLFNYEF
ncbi:MAG: hypothetical protein D3917_12375 [Candidatus Electrothrix sp. AX5]|nr:hypothetical protein [Candidatus Electrothrix sp. AX5]